MPSGLLKAGDLHSLYVLASVPQQEGELHHRHHHQWLWYLEKRVRCLFWQANMGWKRKLLAFYKTKHLLQQFNQSWNTHRLWPGGESVFFCEWKKKRNRLNKVFMKDSKLTHWTVLFIVTPDWLLSVLQQITLIKFLFMRREKMLC